MENHFHRYLSRISSYAVIKLIALEHDLIGSNPEIRETEGKACDGEMLVRLCCLTSDVQLVAVTVQADLYLCGIDSGLCTLKTVSVRLNFDGNKPTPSHAVHHELMLKVH